jgi:hypothetical protein
LNRVDPNSELPHPSIDDDPLPVDDNPLPVDDNPLPVDDNPLPVDNGNNGGGDGGGGDNAGDIGEVKDDEEDGAVAGPTVEAYVELAKTSCTFFLLDTSEAH